MPVEDRKISWLACTLLVVLRLCIGWHLLYEGLWKLDTQTTSQPWTAEGYLKNATGPFRDYFRSLTGDPNDFRWLDYDQVSKSWDDWSQRFVSHYPGSSEASQGRRSLADELNLKLNGPKEYAVTLEQLPLGVDLSKWDKVVTFDAARKRLVVNGEYHLLPSERDAILAQVPLIEAPSAEQAEQAQLIRKYHDAVNQLYKIQSTLSYKERLAALLKGDPERVGILQKEKGGEVIEQRMGNVEYYKSLLERYEANLQQTKTPYQWDHLSRQWGEIMRLRKDLIGPVQALDAQLKTEAIELLNQQQLAAGPPEEPWTPIQKLDFQTMWGLTILGALLIAGLATRFVAIGGAGLLMLFYLAVPPWPGTPPDYGVEHNLIVNKVLIEAVALLAIAAMPTGRWFGIDAIFAALWRRRHPRD